MKGSKTVVTGVSDFHKLIETATKPYFIKSTEKTKYCRDYKNFVTDIFDIELNYGLRNMCSFNYRQLQKIFLDNLNR